MGPGDTEGNESTFDRGGGGGVWGLFAFFNLYKKQLK